MRSAMRHHYRIDVDQESVVQGTATVPASSRHAGLDQFAAH
jgi:hypothetical protein